MSTDSSQKIVRAIEGVVALCVGSAEAVVWVNQVNAAAFSDGEKIFLPKPTGEHPQEYELLLALALREVAKLNFFTDGGFSELSSWVAPFATILEDVRLKTALSCTFKGAPIIFAKAFEIAAEVFHAKMAQSNMEFSQLAELAIWSSVNSAVGSPDPSRTYAGAFLSAAASGSDTGAQPFHEANAVAFRALSANSTAGAVALGQRISELLKLGPVNPDHANGATEVLTDLDELSAGLPGDAGEGMGGSPSLSEAGGPGKPDTSAKPVQTEASAAFDGQREVDQESPGESGISDAAGSLSCGECSGASQDMAADERSPQIHQQDKLSDALAIVRGFDGATVCDPAEAVRASELLDGQKTGPVSAPFDFAAIQKAFDEGSAASIMASVCQGGEMILGPDPASESDHAGAGSCALAPEGGEAQRQLLPAVTGKLVTVLLREFHAQRHRVAKVADNGPRVDASRMWRIKRLGDARVFRKKARVAGVSVAVQILLDRSSSMLHRIDDASAAVYAIGVALQRISGVQTAVDAFPGNGMASTSLLAFKQNILSAKNAFEELDACGGTPTGSAIRRCLPGLLGARVDKRYLFVVTDGKPDSFVDAKQAVSWSAEQGVVVIGIGIRCDVGDLFPLSIEVDSVHQIPSAFADLFNAERTASLTV